MAAWLNSDFQSMLEVLRAWEADVERELDFTLEAAALTEARRALAEKEPHGLAANVAVPKVVEPLVTPGAFAMEFIGGAYKLSDAAAMALHGVDPSALLENVVHLWCCQIFQNNLAHCDPHPGNILWRLVPSSSSSSSSSSSAGVSSRNGTVQPVLLDWGWSLRLSEKELAGLRTFAVAMSDMDLEGAAGGLKAMGYANNQDGRAPERSVAFFAYLFRPTGTRENQAASRKAFFAERKKETEADKKAGTREKGGRKIQSIPKSFMAVTRIFGLLRGLCTSHGVEVNLLEIMATHARLGMKMTRRREEEESRAGGGG